MTSFIQKFIDDGFKVEAAFTKGGWLEVDSRDDLDLYNELYRNNDLVKSFDYKANDFGPNFIPT